MGKDEAFGSQPRVGIANHPNVGTGSSKGGLCFLLFGLPFLATGLLVLAISLGGVEFDGQQNAPVWVIGAFGGTFALVGAGVMGAGLWSLVRQWQIQRSFGRHAEEPWRLDGWDPRKAPDLASRLLPLIGGMLFLALFMTPFNYWAFMSDESNLFVVAIVGLFDLILVGGVLYTLYVIGRRLKYWDAALILQDYPFFVKSGVRVRFQVPRAMRMRFEELRCTLRCNEQLWETRSSGGESSQQLVTYQCHAEERVVDGAGSCDELTLEFQLPEGAPPTTLAGDVVTFYTLELVAETPGIDFRGLYLLPVYA